MNSKTAANQTDHSGEAFVASWLKRLSGIDSPRAAIKHLVRRSLAEFARSGRDLDLPMDLVALSRFLGIKEVTKEKNLSSDAVLVPVPDGFVIRLKDPASSLGRRSFSWAHELGHTFFYERRGALPVRTGELGTEAEETLCDVAAREILLPEPALVRAFGGVNPKASSVESLARLARLARASPQVVASRLAEIGLVDQTVLSGWLLGESGRKAEPCQIVWSIPPIGSKVRLARGIRVEPPSIFHKALATRAEVAQEGRFEWIRPEGLYRIRAAPFSKRVVVASIEQISN